MRAYWLKIALGALVIFLVGYAAVTLVRSQVSRARRVFASADPISIPLAFLPFTMDGQRVGTFRRITIRRESPEIVAGVDFRVQLSDSAAPIPSDCRLTPVEPTRFSPETGFRCAAVADSGLAAFGEVSVTSRGHDALILALVLDSTLIADLRKEGSGVGMATSAFAAGEGGAAGAAAAKQAAEIQDRVRARIDSARLGQRAEVKAAPPAPKEPPK